MPRNNIQYCAIFAIAALIAVPLGNAYAESDDFTKIEGDEIKNSSIAEKILKNIEIAKQKMNKIAEDNQKRTEQQKFVDEQRKIVQDKLNDEIDRMNKKYEEFTPRNAFAKYVNGLNATHHDIYWDQFNYLNAKVSLATKARDSVLASGGTLSEAMREYVRYASMSKIEMINAIQELNIKHSFAQKDVQSSFDANGKLPRFEDDNDSPCYGCDKSAISKVKLMSGETINVIKRVDKENPTLSETNKLKEKLTELRNEFINTTDHGKQKSLVKEMNETVKRIQELQNS